MKRWMQALVLALAICMALLMIAAGVYLNSTMGDRSRVGISAIVVGTMALALMLWAYARTIFNK